MIETHPPMIASVSEAAASDAARYRDKYEGAVVGRRAAATAIAHWYKVDRYDRDYVRGYRRRERVRLARNVMASVARILLGRVEGYSYDEFMGWLQKP